MYRLIRLITVHSWNWQTSGIPQTDSDPVGRCPAERCPQRKWCKIRENSRIGRRRIMGRNNPCTRGRKHLWGRCLDFWRPLSSRSRVCSWCGGQMNLDRPLARWIRSLGPGRRGTGRRAVAYFQAMQRWCILLCFRWQTRPCWTCWLARQTVQLENTQACIISAWTSNNMQIADGLESQTTEGWNLKRQRAGISNDRWATWWAGILAGILIYFERIIQGIRIYRTSSSSSSSPSPSPSSSSPSPSPSPSASSSS